MINSWASLVAQRSKNSPASVGDTGLIPGSGSPIYGNLLLSSCLGKSHGQRGLEGYSPWGHKQSDRTEHTHMHT